MRSRCLTRAFFIVQKWAEMLRHPAFLVAQKRAEMLCHPWGAVKGAPMDTCFRRHESLVYSPSRLPPENVQVPGEFAPWEP